MSALHLFIKVVIYLFTALWLLLFFLLPSGSTFSNSLPSDAWAPLPVGTGPGDCYQAFFPALRMQEEEAGFWLDTFGSESITGA